MYYFFKHTLHVLVVDRGWSVFQASKLQFFNCLAYEIIGIPTTVIISALFKLWPVDYYTVSKFPPGKNSKLSLQLVKEYISFIMSVKDHTRSRRLVFADEKPMKEIDIFHRVQRDPFTGEVAPITCNANSKN